MIVARIGGFHEEEFFEVDDALRGDEGVPKVDFSVSPKQTPPAPTESTGAPADRDGDGTADPPPPPG
jgi:hypothetical protein